MYDDTTSRLPSAVALQVAPFDLSHLRLMLREQIAGDAELLRHIETGGEPGHDAEQVRDRLDFAWALAGQVGGLYADELPEAA